MPVPTLRSTAADRQCRPGASAAGGPGREPLLARPRPATVRAITAGRRQRPPGRCDDGEVTRVRARCSSERDRRAPSHDRAFAGAVARRHIDLLRVSSALCPRYPAGR
ncbi:putative leader peptide [Streptomyces hintoniae]|uniref:putative leader peptide n=1 Tax=Streptomyces hintoniae TaxID=3075521 RepID=UPI0034D96CC0